MQTMVPTAGTAPSEMAAVAASEADQDDMLPGAKAGPWVIERELGRGGMGSVYAVTHEGIGKRAALKVMHRRLTTSSSAERILQEARVVNQVGHPNIVDIFETGALPDGRPYIVMERLEGMPLSYRADEGKILPDQAINILLQVCDALIAAHAANIVHRDLKLDNIFLIDNPDDPANPKVKLLDWGIAKIISTDIRHTIEGQLVGTPQYLAPEQARGATVSPQTDVYSLGVMAYELFLEQLPFEAETAAEIMAMHLRSVPPNPSEIWPEIPPGLEHLLLAMLAKDPEARPTMLTVAHTLELIRSELDHRRQTPVPVLRPATAVLPLERQSSRMPSARLKSSPGFAPTEEASLSAEWRVPKRRWHVVVGAFALAASAAMFLMSRDSETAAAAAPQPTTAEVMKSPAIQEAKADVPEVVAPAPAPAPVEQPVVEQPVQAKPVHHKTYTKKLLAKPRRDASHDPNGTVDPYL
jgi:serine/threonine-protein kinase